jgi:hypothetical protein
VLRARITHAVTVGAIAGVANFAESPSAHGATLRAVVLGALVAGLSGGAGEVIRRSTLGGLRQEDFSEVLSRLLLLEAQVHKLTSLVTAALGQLELQAEQGQRERRGGGHGEAR